MKISKALLLHNADVFPGAHPDLQAAFGREARLHQYPEEQVRGMHGNLLSKAQLWFRTCVVVVFFICFCPEVGLEKLTATETSVEGMKQDTNNTKTQANIA